MALHLSQVCSNIRIFYKYLFKNFTNTKDQILYYILLLLYESYRMIFLVRFKFIYRYITNLIPSLVKRILRAGVSQVATTTFYLSLFGNFLGLLVNKAIWRIIFFLKNLRWQKKNFLSLIWDVKNSFMRNLLHTFINFNTLVMEQSTYNS